MGSRYELELFITSANDLKNVNWRYGPLRPYAVVWVDSSKKCSSRVDEEGDTNPCWNEKLIVPLPPGPIEDHTLYIDIVHAGAEDDAKPLVGSARLNLGEFMDEVSGIGEKGRRTLKLKRPSGRPHGKLEITLEVRDLRYRDPEYHAPPYAAGGAREYVPPPPSSYGAPYEARPQDSYYGSPAPMGYPSSAYNQSQPAYGNPSYGQESYGYGQYGQAEEKKKSKFGGMGTGLAVGVVAGAVGAIAVAEGVDALEDHIADDVAEKVEEQQEEDYYDGGDDE